MLVNFSYQTQFELCSLIFLVGITLHYYLVRRFPTFSNKLFGVILILSIADLSLDIIGCITIEHINEVPVWANYLVNGLFYLIETTLPMLMCIYIVYHSGMTFVRNPQAKLIIIPSLLMALIHMSNPLTGLIFSIRKTENGLMFVTGPIYYSLYVDNSLTGGDTEIKAVPQTDADGASLCADCHGGVPDPAEDSEPDSLRYGNGTVIAVLGPDAPEPGDHDRRADRSLQ